MSISTKSALLMVLVLAGCQADLSVEGGNNKPAAAPPPPAASEEPASAPDDPGPCSGCEEKKVGVGADQAFELGTREHEFVERDGEGALVVNKGSSKGNRYLWVADTSLSGVVKIDLQTLQMVARYRTGGSSTSRTTVNVLGEAFIGARAGGNGKAGVTKVLPLGASCPDKNGDGKLVTSLSPDDVKAWGSDECVAWHFEADGDIRGLAAQDIPGLKHEEACKGWAANQEFDPKAVSSEDKHYVWIGGTHGVVYKLDAATGQLLFKVKSPVPVYGMALSGDGKLWLGAGGGGFGFIDTTKCTDAASCDAAPVCTQSCTVTACPATCDSAVKATYTGVKGGYGITVDHKKRVWRSGYPEATTMRYDPYAPANQRLAYGTASYGGGIAADAQGWVWGANINGALTRLNADTMAGTSIPAPSKGVAVDAQGRVYAVQYEGVIHVVEPGKTLAEYQLKSKAIALKGPAYAYSDMSGVQTRLASGEPGWYREVFEVCPDKTSEWKFLKWDVEAPTGTWAMFNLRVGDTPDALKKATWYTVACIAPPGGQGQTKIDGFKGKLIEVEVRFIASGDLNKPETVKSARIKSFAVDYRCVKVD
jgi:hypothetical protein